MFFSKRQKGQGLVEFALILPVLLLVVLGLIETALLFQAYLAIQHGAREAARFAVSMQPPQGMMFVDDPEEVCDDDNPAGLCACDESNTDNILEETCDPDETVTDWQNRRVRMIKRRALDASFGVRVRDDKRLIGLGEQDYFNDPGRSGEYLAVPRFFGVRVFGYTKNELGQLVQQEDHPSLGGLYVAVVVYHRAEVFDPLFQAIVDSVLLQGRAEMINEGLQIAGPPPALDVPEVLDPEGPPPPPPNDPPDTPVNESPDDPEGLNPEETSNPQFIWSPYNDPDGDPQRYFQVQLRTSGGDYGSAGMRDSGPVEVDSPPVDSWTPSDWDLLDGEYCWHVRVRDSRGARSDYSDETCFFVDVGMSNPPERPINVSPGDSSDSCETIRTAHPQFQWSDYMDLDGDPQSHLQIQLRTTDGVYIPDTPDNRDTGQVASSGSIYTPPWYLDDGEYYWRVRVRDSRGLWSDYSLETCFTVEADAYLAVIGDHEEGEPFVLGEDVAVVIGKHAVTTDYELWWVDPDDVGHSFASVTSDDEGYASQPWSLIDPPDPPDWLELIPGGVPGQVYTCTVQSRVPASGDVVAYQDISVQVPEDLPDLTVTGITLPDSPLANVPMTITVGIANLRHSTVEGFFDVNVYVDPVRPPTLGRPGDSLQWVDGIGPMETRTMTFVITLIGVGDHEVWAFVDATNAVDNESNENNNDDSVSAFAGCEVVP